MVASLSDTPTICGAGHFAALADGIGHFAGLAQTNPDAAVLVADDDQRAEIEPASAFDHFGGAVDEHDLLGQFLPGLRVEWSVPAPAGCAGRDLARARRAARRPLV